MQEIAQEENRIPLPAKASSSLRFLIYGFAMNGGTARKPPSTALARKAIRCCKCSGSITP
jgi:hypothetical protein